MVWEAIEFGWRSQLAVIEDNLTSQRHFDEVVTLHGLPYFRNNPNGVFMHGSARPHAARRTTDHRQHCYSSLASLQPRHESDRAPVGSSGSEGAIQTTRTPEFTSAAPDAH